MNNEVPSKEGTISFRNYNIWYRIVGNDEHANKLPLLCLHGGPGIPHDYLEPLEAVVNSGRRVIFYDQLGCGNSDQPHDPSLWSVDLFLEELAVVRQALGLERVHLLGQSWGGMLALEYALKQPGGLASLILASSTASMSQWISETQRLRAELPAAVQQTMLKHETAGTTADPEYEEATFVFLSKHLCRLDPLPEYVNRTFAKFMQNPEVYNTMWGPSEFYVTGPLKDWEIADRLSEINVPTLITSGRYDESTPAIAETLHRGIAGSEQVLFENSSHFSHAEEAEKYLQVLTQFLERVER